MVPAQHQAVLSPRKDSANAQWNRYSNGTDQKRRKGVQRRRSRDQEETLSKHILGIYTKTYLAILSRIGFTEIHYEAFPF